MSATILIVDDEPQVLKALKLVLDEEGYETLTAGDGETCLTIVQTRHVDLLVLDIMMPRMDGWEILRTLRKQPDTGHAPVIILSAKQAPIDKMLGLDVFGVERYLTKPFSPDELLAAVREVLAH
jgi:DNA-binding response OmpR family regulator